MGHLPIQRVLHVGHLNSVLDPGEGNLTAENKKNQMPGGVPGGGMLMLQIDRHISVNWFYIESIYKYSIYLE